MAGTAELITDATVVTGQTVLPRGWVLVTAGRIAGVGASSDPLPAADRIKSFRGAAVLPGFVDIHVHGGGGASFGSDTEAARRVLRFHLTHGTTSLLAGLSSAPPARLLESVSVLGSLPEAQDGGGRLLGVHLEGPFISAHRRGAHDKIAIRDPDPAELRRLIEAGAGRIRLVTAAPELDRFAELADVAAANSVRLSAGHTDAPGDELLAAVRRGVRSLTHTFNGMRPCLHRDPGPLRVIADSTVVCELICDGIHVHPAFVRLLHRLAGPRRVVLVTDAVAFAGLPDGEHRSDGRLVHVRDRQVVVAGTSTLAGSTLTMAAAVKNYWQMTGADLGGLAAVSSGNAARMLGEDHRIAAIAPGRAADLVVLDEARDCIGVMASGRWIRMPDEPR